jgi:CHAT domain-containing protein
MYAEPTMVLSDTWSVGTVAAALDGLGDRALVVVQRDLADLVTYFALDVGSVRLALENVDPDLDLASALTLGVFPPNRVVVLDDVIRAEEPPAQGLRPGDVLLRHADVLGVVRVGWGEVTSRGDAPDGTGLSSPAEKGQVSGSGGENGDAAVGPSGTGQGRTQKRFRAFAALDAPDAVSVGQQFALSVGFSDQPQTSDEDEQPIIVAGAPPQLEFVVQVAGFGFTFPRGIRRDLTVDRDDPTGVSVEFAVVAAAVNRRATRTLEVSFEYDGERCGQGWHDVVVTNPAATGSTISSRASPADGAGRRSGGTGVALSVDGKPPSLTVEVRIEPGRQQLEWIFHTRDGVPRPDHRVLTELEQPSAQAFAEMLMAQLPAAKGTRALPNVVRGMGKVINRPIPNEFWATVEATWRAAPAGEVPSLLIITGEPFIPWELAWVDADSVDPALYPDGIPEGSLGAMWRVGRWVPPMRRPRGPDRPPAPPPVSLDIDALAVVIGDYAADRNIRQLPNAVEEGRSIALRYYGMPLTVSEGDVDKLMNAELERDGAPFMPQAVHFASHGVASTEQQQYTGIILTGGRKLDLLTVEGSRVGEVSGPFVFLNACQVGTASSVLSSYGGLAGSFLGTGCRGFLAPLWDVDDDVAKDIALEFYDATFRRGLTVGEAVRRIRAGFGDGAKGTATPLAYVFYGHPELRMNWSGRPPSRLETIAGGDRCGPHADV